MVLIKHKHHHKLLTKELFEAVKRRDSHDVLLVFSDRKLSYSAVILYLLRSGNFVSTNKHLNYFSAPTSPGLWSLNLRARTL